MHLIHIPCMHHVSGSILACLEHPTTRSHCYPSLGTSVTDINMASSITVDSLDLGEALVDEKEALATYKRLAGKAGLSEKIATFLVNDMGCRTLEDLENV